MRRLRNLVVGLAMAIGGCNLPASNTGLGDVDWPIYGQNNAGQRYVALNQIDTSNIDRLGLEWYHEFDTDRGQEATPIMVDGVLYVSTAWSKVYAFDARTGRLLWAFDPEVPATTLPKSCCDAVNRGVAVHRGRVFVGTLDGRLIALEAKTGRRLWSVVTVDQSKPYTITGAPIVAGDRVLIGNGGAEYGVRGYISAYDGDTGKLAWRFYTVPGPDGKPDGQPSDKPLRELAEPTWFGNLWREVGGGGTVWDSIVYDPDLEMVYFGVGNGTPHDRKLRSEGKGDNLFLSSIVAVRADSGEYVWHYQTSPGDSWDYTATQHIMLLDLPIGGKPRKLLVQAPKNGFFYVLDRQTGRLISAEPFTRVNWADGIDLKTGKPNKTPNAHYEKEPFLQMPGGLGAHSWHPMAFNPATGLVYIPAQVIAQQFAPSALFKYRPGHMNTGVDMSTLSVPDDKAAVAAMKSATYGELIAWDPLVQKARWKVKHPWFVNGGVLTTAGGLVFQGTAEGELVAYDAATGTRLWSYATTNGIVAPPISYSLGGRQYVAVLVGYGGPTAMYGTITPYRPRLSGRLMVFALDGKAKASPPEVPPPLPVDLDGVSSSGDPVAGLAAYNDTCLICHGFSATGRFTADLRRSQMIKSAEAFRSVVIDGALSELGMVSFAEWVTPRDAENIRAYLIREGRKLEEAGPTAD